MKKILSLPAVFLLTLLSCGDVISTAYNEINDASKSSASKSIVEFNITSPAAAGLINEADHKVDIKVPLGTNVKELVTSIIHTGTAIIPESGARQDFTGSVTYTVKAADGSSQAYLVSVIEASASDKAITSFSFTSPPVTGKINEETHTVALTVPHGTDVKNLVPAITHIGTGITPETGVAQNFENMVTYTVTAADKSTQDYYVTVTIAPPTFDTAKDIGDAVTVSSGAASFKMIYANNITGIQFPIQTADDILRTLSMRFFMGETEVTNALMREVLQWAKVKGYIVETPGVHNEVNVSVIKYGNQVLVDLNRDTCRIKYNSGGFTVISGYDDYPVVHFSWYGAVMFCNWLTEMLDSSTNIFYAGIPSNGTTWTHTDTVENTSRKGYRLPSRLEWEFAARYRGLNSTNSVQKKISGTDFANPANGLYWTTGNSASGADSSCADTAKTNEVAWHKDLTVIDAVQKVAQKRKNQLGLYDMSGNAWEWCFDKVLYNENYLRQICGGSYDRNISFLQIGSGFIMNADAGDLDGGLRIAKTK